MLKVRMVKPRFIMKVSSKNLNILEFLVGEGADINVKDEDGKTPLPKVLCLKKRKGSDMNVRNELN